MKWKKSTQAVICNGFEHYQIPEVKTNQKKFGPMGFGFEF